MRILVLLLYMVAVTGLVVAASARKPDFDLVGAIFSALLLVGIMYGRLTR